MKPWQQIGLMCLPVLCGAACGWIYSQNVVGHQSSHAGWWDLTSLDPISFFVQDIFLAGVFGLLSGGVFMIARAILNHQLESDSAISISSIVATLLVCGWTGLHTYQVFGERAAHKEEVLKQFAIDDAETKKWYEAVAAAFKKLGWVRYPNLRTDDPNVKDGFIIQTTTATFSPADDAETVANYYLEKCESWKEDDRQFFIVVKNEGVPFSVMVGKTEHLVDIVRATEVVPFPNKGPYHWTREKAPETPPDETPAPPPPDPLNYPGADKTEENGSSRLFTHDEMAKVLAYYRSLGARQTDQNDDSNYDHSFESGEGDQKKTIALKSVFETNGEKGTLILIQGSGDSPHN